MRKVKVTTSELWFDRKRNLLLSATTMLASQGQSGSWDTQAWLIGKTDAHVENGKLIPDTEDARKVLEQLGSTPEHGEGDIFKAKPRPNVPEAEKPTQAQRKARLENIKKAQAAKKKQ